MNALPLVLLLQEVGRHVVFSGYTTAPGVVRRYRDPWDAMTYLRRTTFLWGSAIDAGNGVADG
ncbi:MAG: hypothetical protein O2974_08185 [Chloroflexi bacterium]|nr:hypothetical protein [Chloroflexota bacterium]